MTKPRLADVGRKDEAGNYHCPKCDGIQFQPIRSTGRKVMLGFASLLGSANEVRCMTCGAKYAAGAPKNPPIRPD